MVLMEVLLKLLLNLEEKDFLELILMILMKILLLELKNSIIKYFDNLFMNIF